MIRRMVVLAALAATLGGCVLQSRAPRYGDGESVLALGETGGKARMSSWQNGAWAPDDESVEIKVAGKHYEAVAGSGSVTLYFVPLQDEWFIVQGSDASNPAVYMLAEVKQRAAEIRTFGCSDLKKNPRVAAAIGFEGNDCYIKPDAAMKPLFMALLASPGEPVSRLEIVP